MSSQMQTAKELTIMLLYLTSWTEKDPYDYPRSWKGYDFDILNELAEDGAISDSRRSKSVVIYEDGKMLQAFCLKNIGVIERIGSAKGGHWAVK